MKILDASTIIAIIHEINRPDLIDKILKLGHKLVIPSYIVKSELLDKSTREIICKFIKQKKIHVLKKNSFNEIQEFQKKFLGLGLGECDCILSYKKLNGNGEKYYCILDDKKARGKASELDIKYTGLIGLLKLIKNRNIMSSDEINHVIILLKKSNFRIPDVVI